jgi:hypothetical protein
MGEARLDSVVPASVYRLRCAGVPELGNVYPTVGALMTIGVAAVLVLVGVVELVGVTVLGGGVIIGVSVFTASLVVVLVGGGT